MVNPSESDSQECQKSLGYYDLWKIRATEGRSTAKQISAILGKIDELRRQAAEIEEAVNRLEREAVAAWAEYRKVGAELDRAVAIEREAIRAQDLHRVWYQGPHRARGGHHGEGYI